MAQQWKRIAAALTFLATLGWAGAAAFALTIPPATYTLDALGVDLKTGAYTTSVQDISIGSGADALTFTRQYNSTFDVSTMGRGWTHV